jgi:hypothetical protein
VGLGGGVETSPGPVGQLGDPFGPEHRRELAKHAWQAPGGHDRHPSTTTLPQGTWAPWTATNGITTLGVGQDPGGSVGLEGHRAQGGGEWAAAMPQPPAGVEPKSAAVLLGLDHEHPTGPITRWSRLARLPWTARSCRTAHPCRSSGESRRAVRRSPAAPGAQATASGLGLNRSPQPAAMAASAPTTRPSRSTSRRPRTPPPTPTVVAAIRQARVRVHAAHPAARNRRHLPPGRRRPGGRRWLVPAPPPPGLCRREATAASC